MKCPDPDCGGRAYVTEIRHGIDHIQRSRRCGLCGLRFTTREVYADGAQLERKHVEAPVLHPDLSPREAEVLGVLDWWGAAVVRVLTMDMFHDMIRVSLAGRSEAAVFSFATTTEHAQCVTVCTRRSRAVRQNRASCVWPRTQLSEW